MGRNLKDFYNTPNEYAPGVASDTHWAKDKKGDVIKNDSATSIGVSLSGGLGSVSASPVGGTKKNTTVTTKVTRNRDVKKAGPRLAKVALGQKRPSKNDKVIKHRTRSASPEDM